MLNSIYDIGKLWIERENIDKIEVLLDYNELNKTKKVLFVDLSHDGNIYEFNKITEEEYSTNNNLRYLYKKGSSNGANLSPSSLITEPEKTFEKKFLKWFENNTDENPMINDIYLLLNEKKDILLNEIKRKYESITTEHRVNVLLTIRINDNGIIKYLNEYDIFKKLLIKKANEKYYILKSKVSKGESTCYLCDEVKEVYGFVPSSIGLTFGTANKPGNIPEFNVRNQWKQSSICPDCALYLEAGLKFIKKYLDFSEFGLKYYVIPNIFFNKKEVFDELYDDFLTMEEKKRYEEVTSKEEEFADIVKDLDDILEFKFLYYKIKNNAFYILGYVESVIPSWLNEIYRAQILISELPIFNEDNMNAIFSNKSNGNFINRISKMDNKYPLKKHDWYLGLLRDFIYFDNNKYYIDTVNSILNESKIDYDFLLKNIMNKIRSNWRNYDNEYGFMKINVFKALSLILLLDHLNLFKGGNVMPTTNMDTENILDILNTPDKKACFLLGVLTKKLTIKQYTILNSTPFVNKLWGLNIDHEKIKQVFTMVISKLTEYNALYNKQNKALENEISMNLIEADNNWNLKRDEVSYYFVLGFTIGDNFNLIKEGEENE